MREKIADRSKMFFPSDGCPDFAGSRDALTEVEARQMVADYGAIVVTEDHCGLVKLNNNNNAESFRDSLRIYNPQAVGTKITGTSADIVSVTERFAQDIIRLNTTVRFAVGIEDRYAKAVLKILLGRKDGIIKALGEQLIGAQAFVVSSTSTNLGRLFLTKTANWRYVAEVMRQSVKDCDFLGTKTDAHNITIHRTSFGQQHFLEITPLPTPCRVALSRLPESDYHFRLPRNVDPLAVAANRIFSSTTDLKGVTAPRPTS